MKKERLLSLGCSLIIIFLIIVISFFSVTYTPTSPMATLDKGWTFRVGSDRYENVDITHLYPECNLKLKRSDNVSMTITLPDLGELAAPTILFQSRYTTVRCFLDSKEIYSYGLSSYQKKDFTGKMYHVLTLPHEYAGKEFHIDMIVAENNAFTKLQAPVLGTHLDVMGKFANTNFYVIATGIFIFIFGAAFLCIALLFVSNVPEVKSLLFSALFCMNLGAWLLTYYNVLSLFIYTEYETQIEYFTMYMIIPYCYIIVYYIQGAQKSRIFHIMMYFSIAVPAVQLILHYVFNIHLRQTLLVYHIDAVIGFIILCFYAINNYKNNDISASGKMQMTGLVCFVVAGFLHLIIYALESNHIPTIETANKIIICTGCMIFALCQLSTYLIYITDSYAKKQENVSLSHLAYADGLTNLPNRAKADKILDELNSATDDYCIVSIDLNGLKDVNDKFGHPTGDRYIKDFSKVLANSFAEEGVCARIGGDEFIVVLRDAASKDIAGMISRMNSALNVMNALYTEYKRSVATGTAFRHEFKECTSHEVYLLADQRMYEAKRKMHEELGIHARF